MYVLTICFNQLAPEFHYASYFYSTSTRVRFLLSFSLFQRARCYRLRVVTPPVNHHLQDSIQILHFLEEVNEEIR